MEGVCLIAHFMHNSYSMGNKRENDRRCLMSVGSLSPPSLQGLYVSALAERACVDEQWGHHHVSIPCITDSDQQRDQFHCLSHLSYSNLLSQKCGRFKKKRSCCWNST